MLKYNNIIQYYPNLQLTIIQTEKQQNIIIFSNENYICNFFFKKSTLVIDHNNLSLQIKKKIINQKKNLFENFFEKFLHSWDLYYFQKIKFKGKGYRIRKNKKMIKFFFYFSHINLVKILGCKLKKIGKYKFILLASTFEYLKKITLKITKIRKINLFTKRGLRLHKQIVYKRQGKKNAYVK